MWTKNFQIYKLDLEKAEDRYFSKEDMQMANKHVKRYTTSFISREMQIKTTIRYHLMQVRMAAIKKFTNNKCWRRYGGIKGSLLLLVGMQASAATMESSAGIP